MKSLNTSKTRSIRYQVIVCLHLSAILFMSCEDFVEVERPRTDLIKATVFNDDATASAAMADIYYNLHRSGFASGDQRSFTYLASLSSDEQIDPVSLPAVTEPFYKNSLTPLSEGVVTAWSQLYSWIYKANAVIEGLSLSDNVSDEMKKRLTGEALFVRAFLHFYLVNAWGDVPLILSTDYEENANMDRAAATRIYEQIIADLREVQTLLPEDYSHTNNERTRPNKWAATALLARVHLYTNDWTGAERESTAIIDNSAMYGLAADLNDAFVANGIEAILQFPNPFGNYPRDNSSFYVSSSPRWG